MTMLCHALFCTAPATARRTLSSLPEKPRMWLCQSHWQMYADVVVGAEDIQRRAVRDRAIDKANSDYHNGR